MPSIQSLFGKEATILRDTNYQLLLFVTSFPILGAALISPLLESLIRPYGTTPGNVGLLISFFTAPSIAVIPVAGILADRTGRKPVLVASLVCFGVGGAALSLTTDFRVALALRFVQGVGWGGLVPVITTAIGDMYTGDEEATGQGLRITVTGFSGTVFPLVAALLVTVSWRYPFVLYALALPVAGAVALWFDEPTTSAEASTDTSAADETAPSQDADVTYHRALARLVRRRRVSTLVVARTLTLVTWIGFLTYNSLVVVQVLGGSAAQAGLLASLASFVLAVVASQAGRVTARFDTAFVPLVWTNALTGVGFLVFLFAPGLAVALVGVTLFGMGFGITTSLYRSVLTDMGPEPLRAGLVSVAATGSRVVATLTPVVMGGVVTAATPVVGFETAIRLAGVGAALASAGGGIVCVLVASGAPAVPTDGTESPAD